MAKITKEERVAQKLKQIQEAKDFKIKKIELSPEYKRYLSGLIDELNPPRKKRTFFGIKIGWWSE